jgi:hypothetical protein
MNLDFSARPSRPGLTSWLLLALGLAAAGWVMLAWQDADAARGNAEMRLASLQAKPTQKATKPQRADAAALNLLQSRQRGDDAARSQLNLPWARLLDTLQNSRPPEIAFLNLDADGRRGDFTLAAQAKNHAAMLDYFNALQRAPGMARVSLNRHELREADGVQALYFSLRGEWTQP